MPTRLRGFACRLCALFGCHAFGPNFPATSATPSAEFNGERIFPLVRIELGRFARRLSDELCGKLVYVARSFA